MEYEELDIGSPVGLLSDGFSGAQEAAGLLTLQDGIDFTLHELARRPRLIPRHRQRDI